MCQDLLNAGKRQGLGDIDLANLSVSMRAAQYSRVKHSCEMNIAAIGSLARDAFHGVNSRRSMADCLQRSENGHPAHCAPPATVAVAAAVRRPFVAETSALDLVDAVERPELPLDAAVFLVPAAANTAST